MRKIILFILLLSQMAFAQTPANRYEAEMLKNPNKGGKDSREVNAVLVFEKDVLKIISRRKKETFKEFNYSEIKYVEHSYSKTPFFTLTTKAVILTMLTGLPIFFGEKDKHWLTVVTDNDFAVLKIENDNFRLLKLEFVIRKFEIENINENFQ